MRYFDRVLSETLGSTSSSQADDAARSRSKTRSKEKAKKAKEKEDKAKPWSDKVANDLLNDLRKNPSDLKLQEKLNALRRVYPEEFTRWYDKNSNNPDYRHALRQIARRGNDNLVLWMLRHLVSKAER